MVKRAVEWFQITQCMQAQNQFNLYFPGQSGLDCKKKKKNTKTLNKKQKSPKLKVTGCQVNRDVSASATLLLSVGQWHGFASDIEPHYV